MNTRSGKKSPLPPPSSEAPPQPSVSPAASSASVHSALHSTAASHLPPQQAGTSSARLEEWRLEAVLASLLQLNDGKGRILCPPFRVLVSESEFPLYYEQIKHPIDLKRIAQKIREGGAYWHSWQPMETDIKLLVRNAKTFNERGSQIYSDASRLQTHFMARREEISESRRLSAKELAANRTAVDELLRQEAGGHGVEGEWAHSEDSEEDEDSEKVESDPKWMLYWRVRNFEVIDGVPLCEPFLELPSRNCYPDYYDEIAQPMSLFMINRRLKKGDIASVEELLRSLLLIFSNACSYNMDGSDIFQAAMKLREFALSAAKELDSEIDMEKVKSEFTVPTSTVKAEPMETVSGAEKKASGKKGRKRARPTSPASEKSSADSWQGAAKRTSKVPPPTADTLPSTSTSKSSAEPTALLGPLQIPSPDPSTLPPPKRKGRPPGSKNRIPPEERQKPGRKSIEQLRCKFTAKLKEVWKIVKELKMGERSLAEPFLYLPCDKTYPDYYSTVAKPMSMQTIAEKIDEAKYRDSGEMLVDFSLMCANARQYNRPDSQIFTDSNIIESVAQSTMRSLTGGNTIYYPYRKSDKNWSEKISCSVNLYRKPKGPTEPGITASRDGSKAPKLEPETSLSSGGERSAPYGSPAPSYYPSPPQLAPHPIGPHSLKTDSPSPALGAGTHPAGHRIPRNVSKEQQQMHSVFDALLTHQEPGEERLLSDAFMKLPSRADYPDYYKVIKKPMDLNQVRVRLNGNAYDSLKALVADLNLVFDNACKFNDPDSQLYKDALTLQKELLNLKSQFVGAEQLLLGGVQSVQSEVRRILTNILSALMSHKVEGRCLSNSLTDLPDTLRKRGAAAEELPLTLDAIKQNVDAGRYRRLDKFQEDLFSLLHKARQVASSPDSQIFGDSVDLQALYLKRRDELCRNVLCSPACLYIHSQFTAEINELRRVRKKRTTALPATPEAPTSPESGKQNGPDDADEVVEGGEAPTASTEGTDGEKGAEDAPAAGLESVEHGGVTYRLRDYVYVKDTNRGGGSGEPHIMRLEGIERDEEDSAGVVLVKGTWCYRPHETYHRATRRFYPNELFLTNEQATVTVNRLMGRCCLMPLDEYLKRRPTHFDEKDVFVCESRYLGRKLHFRKLAAWPYPQELESLESEERAEPLAPPSKIASAIASRQAANSKTVGESGGVGGDVHDPCSVGGEEANESDEDEDEQEEADRRLSGLVNPLDVSREEVLERKQRAPSAEKALEEEEAAGPRIDQPAPPHSHVTHYQQMEHRGRFYRLGDGVLVYREGKPHCDVMRIDRLWRNDEGEKFFSGCWFARPKETTHEPSRMFFRREVIAVEQADSTERLDAVQAKCAILTLKQYETSRPTEIPECDVFVVDQKVVGKAPPAGQSLTAKNCSLILTKYGESNTQQHSQPDSASTSDDAASGVEMNMELAKPIRKLKPYNLLPAVVEDEIYYFKSPLTMEKELSPQLSHSDTSLPIDEVDLEREQKHVEEQIEHFERIEGSSGGGGVATKDAHWLASQPKLNAKSKSGYILFSAEIRKRIMHENPESGFGEVSKIVGLEWKKLTEEEKRQFEVRAHLIADERAKADLLTPSSKLLQPGQIRVYYCRWQMCDFQFDSIDGLYEHLKSSHTCMIPQDGTDQFVCLWTSCLKYRKEGKPFPSLPRLHRHLKEKHLPSSSKAIYPNQKSKHFFAYLPPRSLATPSSSTSSSPTKGSGGSGVQDTGLFIHQPYGVQQPNAVACSVATPIASAPPTPGPHLGGGGGGGGPTVREAYGHTIAAAYHHGGPQHASQAIRTHPNGAASYSTLQHHAPSSSSNSSASHTTTQYILTTPSSVAGSSHPQSGGGTVQQLVQHTLQNGTTVYIPAGSAGGAGQYHTAYVVNQQTGMATPATVVSAASTAPSSTVGGAGGPQAMAVLHHQGNASGGGGQSTPHHQQVYIQHQPGQTIASSSSGQPGHAYVQVYQQQPSSSSGGQIATGSGTQQQHMVQVVHQAPPGTQVVYHQSSQSAHPSQQAVVVASSSQPGPNQTAVASHLSTPQPPQPSHPHHQLHHQQAQAPMMAIDPGRTVVEASKRPEPVFVPPLNSIPVKRVVHSEAYLRYIESLYANKRQKQQQSGAGTSSSSAHSQQPSTSSGVNTSNQSILRQRAVSKWERSLIANQRNTTASSTTAVGGLPKRLTPYDWIKASAGGSKQREDEMVRALWRLREQLVEGTTDIQRTQNSEDGSSNGGGSGET